MIRAWDRIIGSHVEARLGGGGTVRGVLAAVAMESVATATKDEVVGEFAFLLVTQDGDVHEVPARSCKFLDLFPRKEA